jgi:hypothetical protein
MFWAIWRFLSETQRNPSWTALSASLGGETSVTELAPPAQCTNFVLDYNPGIIRLIPQRKYAVFTVQTEACPNGYFVRSPFP